MGVEEFRALCLSQKGTTEEFPFGPENLVYKVMGKMFAMVSLDRIPAQCNLKCDPERAMDLREQYDGTIFGAYHMNKQHWNTLLLDHLPPPLVVELTGHSYGLVVAGLTKKQREQLESI